MSLAGNDTIVAPATIPGTGALSLIRISGADALSVCDAVLSCKVSDLPGYSLKYATVSDASGKLLDTVMVSVFRAPHSYTGEDSAEISCHASKYIVSELLSLLCDAGARMAGPGEFTKRAFLNSKMDLSQAEAVADVISSNNSATHRVAMTQLRGGYSQKLQQLRDELLDMASLLELELDFSEEDVEFADRKQLKIKLEATLSHVRKLIDSYKLGNVIKNGIAVAIVGPVNAGKSTLLNAILGEDRAIVSETAGTTRDTIEESITLGGMNFRFIDTAGLRDTSESIESEGIRRSLSKISEAQLVLLVLDGTATLEELESSASEVLSKVDLKEQKVLILLNKCEKNAINKNVKDFNIFVASVDNKIVTLSISAKDKIGLDILEKTIIDQFSGLETSEDAVLVTNIRHLEALKSAEKYLVSLSSGLAQNSPTDLLAQDLRDSIESISSILGQTITPDTILHHIFQHHCIGK